MGPGAGDRLVLATVAGMQRVPATLMDDRVVVVTGAARGIGKGIAIALTERGASVLLVDRDEQLLTRADYDLVFDVGPRATFEMMQAIYPVFVGNGGGSIVNLGSGSGTMGLPRFGAYAAAKEAIRGMSKVAALEWGRENIRVNVVCPYAETDSIRMWREMAPETYERTVRGVPLGRLGDVASDIGPVVGFLLSDESSYVTAQTIMVDGGAAGFR